MQLLIFVLLYRLDAWQMLLIMVYLTRIYIYIDPDQDYIIIVVGIPDHPF